MRRDLDKLQREVDGLASQTISSPDERVVYERRDGNHERAIGLLRSFIDHEAAALGPHCRAIAERAVAAAMRTFRLLEPITHTASLFRAKALRLLGLAATQAVQSEVFGVSV